MTVVKVGGSLLDHPGLLTGLRAWRGWIDGPVLFVPGGGAMADIVREWDRVHRLGDELSHRLAIRTMAVVGELLRTIPGCDVFDCESVPSADGLPHSWAVTSDSIAAWIAGMTCADRLVLLKSVDVPAGVSWSVAATNGWVDEHFPTAAARVTCPIEVVNFRQWLDQNGFGK
jgi:5-(aminomethyl)-3-furanmethanol phosphate kinase